MPKKTRRSWSPEEKAEILQRFHSSGLSREAFSRKERIASSVLSYWLQKQSQGELTEPKIGLVPVQVKTKDRDGHPTIEIIVRSGQRIRVAKGFDTEVLKQVISLLDQC